MATAVAAVIIRKEKQLVAHLQEAGALSPETARSLSDLRIDENVAFRRLRRRAVVREGAPGLFYLDEASWQALRGIRRRLLIMVLLLVVIALALVTRTSVTISR